MLGLARQGQPTCPCHSNTSERWKILAVSGDWICEVHHAYTAQRGCPAFRFGASKFGFGWRCAQNMQGPRNHSPSRTNCKRWTSIRWCSWINFATNTSESWNLDQSDWESSRRRSAYLPVQSPSLQLGSSACCLAEQQIHRQTRYNSFWENFRPYVHWQALHVWWKCFRVHQTWQKGSSKVVQRYLVGQSADEWHSHHWLQRRHFCDTQCTEIANCFQPWGPWWCDHEPMGIWICSAWPQNDVQQTSFSTFGSWYANDRCWGYSSQEVCSGESKRGSGTRACFSGGAGVRFASWPSWWFSWCFSCWGPQKAWFKWCSWAFKPKESSYWWGATSHPSNGWHYGLRHGAFTKGSKTGRITKTANDADHQHRSWTLWTWGCCSAVWLWRCRPWQVGTVRIWVLRWWISGKWVKCWPRCWDGPNLTAVDIPFQCKGARFVGWRDDASWLTCRPIGIAAFAEAPSFAKPRDGAKQLQSA